MRGEYKNVAEEQFCKWVEKKGFYPIKRGWPDFFCRHPETGEVIFVEVKPHAGEYLKVEQYVVMSFLVSKGIKCYRWNPVTKVLQPIVPKKSVSLPTLPQDTAADVSS